MATIEEYNAVSELQPGDVLLVQRNNQYVKINKEQFLAGFNTDELGQGVANKYLTPSALISMLQSSVTENDLDINPLKPLPRSIIATLGTADIDALKTTPFEILPPPPTGKEYFISGGVARYERVGGDWTGTSDLEVRKGAGLVGTFANNIYTGTSNRIGSFMRTDWYEEDLNQPVTVSITNNTNGGDGFLYIMLEFYLVNLS